MRVPTGKGKMRVAVLGALLALSAAIIPSTPVAAHGCGTTDHVVGLAFHYYEGQVIIGNGRFNRWWEVNLGSAGYNYTFCGCVNPSLPCVYSAGLTNQTP